MDNPKHPIPLDYKTPEKSERVTADMIAGRVIMGSVGIFGMLAGIAGFAVIIFFLVDEDAYDFFLSNEPNAWMAGVLLGGLAITLCMFSLRLLKWAIVGVRKCSEFSIESNQ